MKKILVIEDELAIRDLLELVLKRENYQVKTAENGTIGLAALEAFKPDLVLLDLMLPDYSGYDLCKAIEKKYTMPVIILSAKNEIIDKVLGLELGAEDYITKPFDNRELLARVKVVLRRYAHTDLNQISDSNEIVYGELIFNRETRMVIKNETRVFLTAKEFKMLETFLVTPNRIFTRDDLLDIIWGFDYLGDSRCVDMTIMRLRKKLEDDVDNPRYVKTIYGFGYQLGGASE